MTIKLIDETMMSEIVSAVKAFPNASIDAKWLYENVASIQTMQKAVAIKTCLRELLKV